MKHIPVGAISVGHRSISSKESCGKKERGKQKWKSGKDSAGYFHECVVCAVKVNQNVCRIVPVYGQNCNIPYTSINSIVPVPKQQRLQAAKNMVRLHPLFEICSILFMGI